MSDEVKNLKTILKELLQPLQGEISRLTTETRNTASKWLHVEHVVSQNGKEIARLSSDMENMKDWLGKEMSQVQDKLDALTSDVIDLQDNIGIMKDQMVGIDEKFIENKEDIQLLKRHTGLPLN